MAVLVCRFTISISAPAVPGPLHIAGYDEGTLLPFTSPLDLTCATCFGAPPPTVEWLDQDGSVLNQTSKQASDGCTTLVIHFPDVGHSLRHGDTLTCRLVETGETASRTVSVDMPCVARHVMTNATFGCVLPFEHWSGTSHNGCMKGPTDTFWWCPTTNSYSLNSNEYGFCSEDCPWEKATSRNVTQLGA